MNFLCATPGAQEQKRALVCFLKASSKAKDLRLGQREPAIDCPSSKTAKDACRRIALAGVKARCCEADWTSSRHRSRLRREGNLNGGCIQHSLSILSKV